ncbi:MAG: hypothetical protein WDO24_21695 [Pseudomonadota bacterium]
MSTWLAVAIVIGGIFLRRSQSRPPRPRLRKTAINFGLTYVPVGNSPVFAVPQAMGF